MRIRKNAPKLVHKNGPRTSFISCHLNSSPWDVDSFLITQNDHIELPLNGNSNDSIPASTSIPSRESMEFEYIRKTPSQSKPDNNNNNNNNNKRVSDNNNNNVVGGEDEEIGVTKTKPPRRNNSSGDGRGKPSPGPLPPKKVGTPSTPALTTLPKKRGRPRKPTTSTAAANNSNSNNNKNPYEFYYYSGFGPSWGSRRRASKYNKGNNNVGDYMDEDGDNNFGNGIVTPGISSTTRESISEDDNLIDIDDDENAVSRGGGGDGDQFVDDDLYDDEDDDEDDYYYYVGGGGGKRARKPIKARSLKSLM